MSAAVLPLNFPRNAAHGEPPAFELIDIGANLTHSSFAGDLDAVLQAARGVGISKLLVTGASLDGSVAAMQLAEKHPEFLYSTAGIHPHHAHDYNDFAETLLTDLLKCDWVKAAGECGLDYNRNFSPRDAQLFAFERQLELAIGADKPVFLHQRDAHQDFLAVLKTYRAQLCGAVVHCFTDTATALEEYLALDCYIGITGWLCDERRGQDLIHSVARIPDARLMIETDAPYLLPRTLKPAPKDRRNVPAFLPWVLCAVADARGQTVEHVAQITSQNARQFFRL